MIARIGTALATLLIVALAFGGCEKGPKVKLVRPKDAEKSAAATAREKGEEDLREEFEERKKARENAPEPKLDPSEPREKNELIWKMGKARLNGIYTERAEILDKLTNLPFLEKGEKKQVKAMVEKLSKFGVPRAPAEIDQTPDELCKLVSDIRGPAEAMIVKGTAELEKVQAKTKELEAKADGGGSVYQKQWDKLDEQSKRWSAPVLAGKNVLLGLRTVLDEALVLADLGARRVQLKLKACLGKIAEKPFEFELTQTALEKALTRSKYYRELR